MYKCCFLACFCWIISIYIIQFLHAGRISLTPLRARHWTLQKLLWRKIVSLMSACSGRNYNFRCIKLMLFFGVFLRESGRTAAKSRTSLSTNSGKATKRLGRLVPNLSHMCKFIWKWICRYTPNKLPLETQGRHLGGFKRSTIQKYGEAVRLAQTLVHVCGFIWKWTNTSRPSIPQGAFRGGGG